MNKLTIEFQAQFHDRLIYDPTILNCIDPVVKLHDETLGNPLSSSAACLNVLGSLLHRPEELINFLNQFGLEIETIYEFPGNCVIGGRTYSDNGYVIFEWVGPQTSPINEKGGGRGFNRTSVDAFVIAKIKGKVTQLLIEWKFTEGKSRPLTLDKFSGLRGVERLSRYSSLLTTLRGKETFPFKFKEEGGTGLPDFSPDHLYQLLRMTLLAKMTTPIQIGNLSIEDYRIVHLSHSANQEIEILHNRYLQSSPGLKKYAGQKLYDVWTEILSSHEQERFKYGHWDKAMISIKDNELRTYLTNRY
ncbi:MAG: hypothetical protein K0B15_09905 [Lentimicrobium sp.]|nr:hypothetical protein [Lentimicrobium sp.]